MGNFSGENAAGVVKNIGDCIPRYTILGALDFLYKADVLMAVVYILIVLGIVIFILLFLEMRTCVKGSVVRGVETKYKNAPLGDSNKLKQLGTNFMHTTVAPRLLCLDAPTRDRRGSTFNCSLLCLKFPPSTNKYIKRGTGPV